MCLGRVTVSWYQVSSITRTGPETYLIVRPVASPGTKEVVYERTRHGNCRDVMEVTGRLIGEMTVVLDEKVYDRGGTKRETRACRMLSDSIPISFLFRRLFLLTVIV